MQFPGLALRFGKGILSGLPYKSKHFRECLRRNIPHQYNKEDVGKAVEIAVS